MAYVKWSLPVLALVCPLFLYLHSTCASNCVELSNTGQEFYLGIPYLNSSYGQPEFSIYVASGIAGIVDVEFEKLNLSRRFVLRNRTGLIIPVPNEYRNPRADYPEHNGIFLKSDVDASVSVVSKPFISGYMCGQNIDGYLALPRPSLSTKYIIESYEPLPLAAPYSYLETAEVLVVATEDNTSVSINYGGNSSNVKTVLLNRLDTVMFKDSTDVTGATVLSDKPVAVVSATNLANVQGSFSTLAESLYEWVYPKNFAAHDHIVPGPPDRAGFILRVLVIENNTSVTFQNKTDVTTVLMQSYQRRLFLFGTDPVYVHSDKPVLVYQYSTTTSNLGAFERNIPAVENYVNNASFVYQSSVSLDNYVQVMVQDDAVTVTYDGANILQHPSVSNVQLDINGSTFNIITLNTADSAVSDKLLHFLSTNNSFSTFGAVIAGYTRMLYTQCAYGYPLAVKTKECRANSSPATESPHTVTTTAGHSTNTTDVGPLCLECNDLSQLYMCEVYTKCSADQVCYVERYKNVATQIRYRTGCIQKDEFMWEFL